MDNKLSIRGIFERLKRVKNIEYFIFILAIAIIISLVSNIFRQDVKEAGIDTAANPQQSVSADKEEPGDSQEARLKKVLSAIRGAGSVEVMITYKSGKEVVPAMSTQQSDTETEEQDSSGGIRKVKQTDINSQPISMNSANGSQALITLEIEPEIKGVIVVAEGAEDLKVRLELARAVQTVLGVQANQVEVFVMDDNKIKE